MSDFLVVAAMAAVWWIPTFLALTDLQRRTRVRRVLVWKWMGLLCIPVLGAALYYRWGRSELDADTAANARQAHPRQSPPKAKGGRTR